MKTEQGNCRTDCWHFDLSTRYEIGNLWSVAEIDVSIKEVIHFHRYNCTHDSKL